MCYGDPYIVSQYNNYSMNQNLLELSVHCILVCGSHAGQQDFRAGCQTLEYLKTLAPNLPVFSGTLGFQRPEDNLISPQYFIIGEKL